MTTEIIDQVVVHLESMPRYLQEQVLRFVQSLQISAKQGTPGKELLRLAGTISEDELQQMSQAIEEGCEQVDAEEW